MRWFYTKNIKDRDNKETYLKRWGIRLPFGYSLKLHHILRADSDLCQHDHPWWFVTFMLWGGYEEELGRKKVIHKLFSFAFRNKKVVHRIVKLPKGHAWTLVFTGPTEKSWGFLTKKGLIDHDQFLAGTKENRIMWCED